MPGDFFSGIQSLRIGSTADHIREHRSMLAAAEKRALVFLAHRMPAALNSDHLTLLALVSMAGAGLAFAAARTAPWCLLLVVAALAVNWFGDSLDGTLARVREQQRPRYGYYVDHVLDTAGTTCLMVGLAVSGYMSPVLAVAVLAAYLLVASESYLATHAIGVFRISFFGFGPTELRIVLATGALFLLRQPRVDLDWIGLGAVRLFDVGGAVAIVGLAITFIVSAVRNARALYLSEPLPARRAEARVA